MSELVLIENILKILRKGKYTLEGDEVLAFYRSFEYLIAKRKELLSIEEAKKVKVVDSAPISSPSPAPKKSKKSQ